jgi:hypothetical protein
MFSRPSWRNESAIMADVENTIVPPVGICDSLQEKMIASEYVLDTCRSTDLYPGRESATGRWCPGPVAALPVL